MPSRNSYDAVVVGSGPNGLAAAIVLAQAGKSVLVMEAADSIGGGTRSAQVTLPGYIHDICSAIHPLAAGSPFFKTLPLEKYGLEWVFPTAALAHPFDDGSAALLVRSIEATSQTLGVDGASYQKLIGPALDKWDSLISEILGPLRVPKHPLVLAQFGLSAVQPARFLAANAFKGERARAFFSGMAAHSILKLEQPVSASFGIVLAACAHAIGWPLAAGGSQCIADALAAHLGSLGGEIQTASPVKDLGDIPPTRATLFDVTPRQLVDIAGPRFRDSYRRKLAGYRYGPGVFKLDWALDGPIPWKATDCLKAGTVHLGATMEEIAESERTVWAGQHPERPYALVTQASLFDPSRAPTGKHTAWAYCHVPNGSTFDMTERIENQIERFAPGFRDLVLARRSMTATEMGQYNPNYVGGDINGGVQDVRQLFTRPTARISPYTTPDPDIYICSSSTPPGGGVHGMCGYHAAHAALKRSFA